MPGFADFGGGDAGDAVEVCAGKAFFKAAHGELDEVAGLGQGAFGEALFFFFEGGDFEERFANFLAIAVVDVTFRFELFDKIEVSFFSEDGEFFAVRDGLSAFIEDELTGGAVAFPAIDLRPGEDQGVKGVGFAG